MAQSWWKDDYSSSWERTKEAFRRDWEQTKHDFGGDAPDLNQDVGDTVKQAAGKQAIPGGNLPNFDEHEPAFRYGHGARQHYGTRVWDDSLEADLARDYEGNWESDKTYVRRSYTFAPN